MTSVRRQVALALFACLVMTLSACEDRPTRDSIDQHAEQTRQSLDNVMAQSPAKHYNPLVVTDKIWAGNTATRMQRGMPLPPRYENPRGITLVSAEPMSLADIANAITEQTGISVRVSQVGGAATATAGASNSSSTAAMPMAYEGPLSGLMERVAGYFGVNWRFDGSSISVTRFETRVFVIEAMQGNSKTDTNVSSGSNSSGSSSGGGGGGGGSSSGGSSSFATLQSTLTQTAKYTIDNKYWEELGQIITSMLGGTGTVVVSPSMGSITVTTTPEIMHTVAEYLSLQNQRLSRQIAINVEIYTVDLANGLDFNIAFTAAIKKVTALATGFTGAGAPASVSGFTGGGLMNVAIIDPKGVGTYTDVFTALSGIGDTTKVAKFPMVTLNNIPVIRRIGEQISYVASTSTTVTGTSGTAVASVSPGAIPKGFSIMMTPRILDDGRILLDYSLDIIDIVQIKQFNSQCGDTTSSNGTCSGGSSGATGSSTVQLPDTTERAFTQQSVLKSGSTLIMGGAEEEDLTQNSQGVGSPYNYFLGGGVSSRKDHTMIFFVITPQVVDTPRSEQE